MSNKNIEDFVYVGDVYWANRPMYKGESSDEYIRNKHAVTRPYFILKREKLGVIALPLTTSYVEGPTGFYNILIGNHPETLTKTYRKKHGIFSDKSKIKFSEIIKLKDYDLLDLLLVTNEEEIRDIFGKLYINHLNGVFELEPYLFEYIKDYYKKNFKPEVGDIINVFSINNDSPKYKPNFCLITNISKKTINVIREKAFLEEINDNITCVRAKNSIYSFDETNKISLPYNSDYIIKYKNDETVKQLKKSIY